MRRGHPRFRIGHASSQGGLESFLNLRLRPRRPIGLRDVTRKLGESKTIGVRYVTSLAISNHSSSRCALGDRLAYAGGSPKGEGVTAARSRMELGG